MAKKEKAKEGAKSELPLGKNTLALAAVLIIIVVIAAYSLSGGEDTVVEDEEEDEIVIPPAEEEEEEETQACTTNEDCDDGNGCTTDSCDSGTCVNTIEAYCSIEEEAPAYINAVNFEGVEYVELYGKNAFIEGWTITNANGDVFITFPDYYKLNGYVKVYSAGGITTTTKLYVGLGNDWWSFDDKAQLRNPGGEIMSQRAASS